MIRRVSLRLLPLLLLLWSTLVSAAPRARHVFIVSLDGGSPAVVRASKMPTLEALVREGAHSWEAQTIFPSITLVSHTSMLTGVTPEKHQVTWNDWIPDNGLVKVPTIFSLSRAKGYTTALFAGKPKFEHLHLPGSLGVFLYLPGARRLAEVAARYIEVAKPNLCFVHFPDTDSAGHAYGWGSPQQTAAFAEEDAALDTLRRAIVSAGLAEDSVMIVTADHGGHEKTHGTRSPEDMTIPWIAWGHGVKSGFTLSAPITTYDTAATALWLLDVPIPADWDGKPVLSAFTAE